MKAMGIIDTIRGRDQRARAMLVERADVTLDDVRQAAQTLSKLGAVDLADLITHPGFDSLGNANAETEEWRQWAAVSDLVEESRRLGYQLGRAYFEARGE